MAVTLHCNRIHNSTTTGHSQLVRSLERILEEANLSGELLLANRKLKDFPKAATKYNLSDTVIADLSRNRFCELPEEVTTFAFLETLLLFHNTIRHIPESVKHLTLLTYLDLRSNQLSTLPRELCFMPLQVLLVSNNRLVSLPEELGRMDKLTDLDASYNQLTALPSRIGELRSLKSFSLRNNQILYLPRELACLSLVSLDVSNNRIANLPLEIRQMTTLVEFNLGNNPLTSPPASLCVRGLVHIFKFLETQASKEEKGCRAGGNYDGYTTLRRAPKQHAGSIFESARTPRSQTEFGYNTCDGMDKRWSHESPNRNIKSELSSPRKILTPTNVDNFLLDVNTSIESNVSKGSPGGTKNLSSPERNFSDQNQVNDENNGYTHSSSTSSGSTPEDDMLIENQAFIDKNNKQGGNIQQTYREYKEALKQQRNQEISSVYKAKPKTHHEANETNGTTNTSNNYDETESRCKETIANNITDDTISVPKKPVQKVIPSRNTEIMNNVSHPKSKEKNSSQNTNGECIGYVKPNSPMKSLVNGDISTNNNSIATNGVTRNKFAAAVPTKQQLQQQQHQQFLAQNKTNRSVTWNHDLPPEKLSFTMRREFDRQREESELMMQLRNIIQVRLKTILPEDMASALTDGVILCHLANYVRPRSVASIHVPSPGVSKLTMARCRRNVDNFLEACRKIGVDEELICSCEDVVPPDDDDDDDDSSHRPVMPNPSAVFKTVSALLLTHSNTQSDQQELHQTVQQHQDPHQQQPQELMEEHQPPATNMQLTEKWENKLNAMREMTTAAITTTKEQQHEEEVVVSTKEGQFGKFLRHAKIKTFQKIKLNLTNNNGGLKFSIGTSSKDCQLQTIEETETDSYQIVNEKLSPVVLKVNDLNTMKFKLLEITPSNNNNDDGRDTEVRVSAANCVPQGKAAVVNENSSTPKIVTKRIEFFEDRCSPSGEVNNTPAKNIYSIYQATNAAAASKSVEDDRLLNHDFNVLTIVLSCVFIATFVLLVIFPLPD